jgi:hypothetical protein
MKPTKGSTMPKKEIKTSAELEDALHELFKKMNKSDEKFWRKSGEYADEFDRLMALWSTVR